jgi:hypothetical protein
VKRLKQLLCRSHEMRLLSRHEYPTYRKATTTERCIKCGKWEVRTRAT